MGNWTFQDPPNVAVIVNRKILEGREWIAFVTHDEDDGCWQFHTGGSGPLQESDAALVSLEEILKIDSTLIELVDLPLGWQAIRSTRGGEWYRSKIS